MLVGIEGEPTKTHQPTEKKQNAGMLARQRTKKYTNTHFNTFPSAARFCKSPKPFACALREDLPFFVCLLAAVGREGHFES